MVTAAGPTNLASSQPRWERGRTPAGAHSENPSDGRITEAMVIKEPCFDWYGNPMPAESLLPRPVLALCHPAPVPDVLDLVPDKRPPQLFLGP